MWVCPKELAARVTSTMITFIRSGSWLVAVDDERGDRQQLLAHGDRLASTSRISSSITFQRSRKSVSSTSSLEAK
jgi:hypothetical protein